jgi:hypothetical protein
MSKESVNRSEHPSTTNIKRVNVDNFWDRLWLTQLYRLHAWHLQERQKLRSRLREVETALQWAHACVEDQRRMRLEVQAQRDMAVHVAAELGIESVEAYLLNKEDSDE